MDKLKFETKAIRTQEDASQYREHTSSIYMSSSFTFDHADQGAALFNGEEDGNIYTRYSNPNTTELVNKLCELEECEAGLATSSGMSAIHTCFAALLKKGDHLVASKDIFGNVLYILNNILPDMGIEFTLVDIDDNEGWANAIQENTKVLYVETPSNPTLKIADLDFLNQLAKAHDLVYMVDNCFATPYLQQPAKFGADLVVHSATKFIDGQGRVIAGAVVGNSDIIQTLSDYIRRTGACLSPFNAWILSKSLETLAVRMDRHCDNAMAIAQYLSDHPKVSTVTYPHLPSHPRYEIAQRQMMKGGGLVSFDHKDGLEGGKKFLNHLKIHSLTANLGDCRSIATHPASTTHSKVPQAAQLDMGITPGFIRLSVGLEHIDDLIADLDAALEA